MKKKTVAILCAVLVLVLAGAGTLWYFLRSSGSKEDEAVVYVNTVAQLTGIMQGNGLQNRFAGTVESKNTWKVEKNTEKTVKEIYVEEGQEVVQGTPLFSYDTDQFQANLEQARLDLERGQNEISSMSDNIAQLRKEKKSAPKEQQASLTLEIQQAELDLKKKEYEIKSKQTEIEGLESDILNATVVSEIAGVVKTINKDDSNANYYYGNSDNSFITVLETGTFQVKASVNEQNMSAVSQGMPVIVHSRADSEKTWTGTISKIDLENATAAGNIYGGISSDSSATQSSNYPFYVDLNTTDGLMLGQHVYIEVDNGQGTEPKTGLWLPEYYINDIQSSPYVWADNGKTRLEKRALELGAYDESTMEYEIKSGLTEEDANTFPEDGLEEGMTTVLSEDGSLGLYDPNQGASDDPENMTDDGMIMDDGAGMDDMLMDEEMMTDGADGVIMEDGTDGMITDDGSGADETMTDDSGEVLTDGGEPAVDGLEDAAASDAAAGGSEVETP